MGAPNTFWQLHAGVVDASSLVRTNQRRAHQAAVTGYIDSGMRVHPAIFFLPRGEIVSFGPQGD